MPRTPSPNTRVLVAIALLAISSLVIGGLALALTESERSEVQAAAARLENLDEIYDIVSGDVSKEESALDEYMLTGDAGSLANYHAAAQGELAALERLANGTFGLPEVESALAALGAISEDWRSMVADPAIAARSTGNQRELDRFAGVAAEDHEAVDTAAGHVHELLGRARDSLASHASAVERARVVAVSSAFAVFVIAFALALIAVRRFGQVLERDARQAGVINRFTEVTSFAGDDGQVAAANLAALARLVRPDASVTHVLNRSLDRAVPEAVTGEAIADVLPLFELGRCAGMRRGSMYVTDDLSDDLSVRCPVYPAPTGTLACVPLTSGESVGAVHLYWNSANALPLGLRATVTRVAEHAALAIGNRRLLAALQGQANTDPRTGLANSRAFDSALEEALAARAANEHLSVLILDLDHFKQFNDRHGHPAGDEALRTFAGVLRSCMREGDVAARYGGEEFAVLLPGVDRRAGLAIAERIRARTESTIVSLAPGLTDRITASIGVASAPEQGLERVALLRLADEAVYQAKAEGRNRVWTAAEPEAPITRARRKAS